MDGGVIAKARRQTDRQNADTRGKKGKGERRQKVQKEKGITGRKNNNINVKEEKKGNYIRTNRSPSHASQHSSRSQVSESN